MGTQLLVMNLRGSSWDYIPDDMWRNIIERFAAKICNRISFDSVASAECISRLSVFADHSPVYVGQTSYCPNSIPFATPDAYRHDVAMFQFDEWVASLIVQHPLNSWHASNDGADVDELVFWDGDEIKLQAIPYEGHAYFFDLSQDERRRLINADTRIESNLFAV